MRSLSLSYRGVLVPLSGSKHEVYIHLDKAITSYGRDPSSHVRFPNPKNRRVPINAFNILFWRPNFKPGSKCWEKITNLMAVICTRSKKVGVKVNQKRLVDGDWAILQTHDIITVYKNGDDFQEFTCYFFKGPSVEWRENCSSIEVKNTAEKTLHL